MPVTNHNQRIPNSEIERLHKFQDVVLSIALNKEINEETYQKLRYSLVESRIGERLPKFIRDCENSVELKDFFQELGSITERRRYVLSNFLPLVDIHNSTSSKIIQNSLLDSLQNFEFEAINMFWLDALELRAEKPYLAIALSTSLIETVCIFILESMKVKPPTGLEKLYKKTASVLKLAPDEHTEANLKSMFENCTKIIRNLGTFRNRASGAHGTSVNSIRPSSRHSTLALNLAGSMSIFLIETYLARIRDK